jgi:tRNA 2-thiouridine synthesizing protein B
MILYTFNKTPSFYQDLKFAFLAPEDALLFFEDGVYCLVDAASSTESITTLARSHPCYALAADVAARGLQQRLIPDVKLVSYEDWVDLSLAYEKVINF